jgi:uncharacterized protein (TIGR03435 family)
MTTSHLPSRSAGLLLLALAILLSAFGARSQSAHEGPEKAVALAASLPPYDVISVKQNISGGGGGYGTDYSGIGVGNYAFSASNVPLKQIIELAYGVKEDQIFGLTGPVSSARFDIEAKVVPPNGGTPPKLTDAQLQAMIIPLLADRFHLTAHLETKTLPVYELVVARGGPKFTLSQTEGPGGGGWGWKGTNKSLNYKGISMADLADTLSDRAHREVINKTGLTGRADITLKWSDDVAAEQGGTNSVSIFTAVEEQLGLKLQPSKGPVQTLIINHAEMPSAN